MHTTTKQAYKPFYFIPTLKGEAFSCNRPIDPKAIISSGEHDEVLKRHRLDNQTASAYLIAMRET
jgi:hypothetical protein